MKTDKGTIIRTIILVITWVNLILANNGLNEIPLLNEEEVAMGLALGASIVAWFKNNYVTAKGKAQKATLERNNLD